MLLSLSFHEFSHGYVAFKLGDPTAKQAGRLTLNPLAHIDPLGTLCMLIFRFGWAKPVPVNVMYFKDRKKGMAITAAAGPISNLLLAFLCLLLFVPVLVYAGWTAVGSYAANFLYIMVMMPFSICCPSRRLTAPRFSMPCCPTRFIFPSCGMSGIFSRFCFCCCGRGCSAGRFLFCETP